MDEAVDWQDIAAEVTSRDPREYPIGYHTGGSFVLDGVSVFMWFKTREELIAHLRNVEPRVFDLKAGEGLEEYRAAVDPVLARMRVDGLTENLLAELNSAAKDSFQIYWWGTFDELLKGEGEFERDILDGFLDEEREGRAIGADEIDEFVEYLKTSRC